jgi:hypothetical protein
MCVYACPEQFLCYIMLHEVYVVIFHILEVTHEAEVHA